MSLLIVKPDFLKYSIQDVNESNFKVWPIKSEFTKVFPSFITSSTGILLRVPNLYISFLSSFIISTNLSTGVLLVKAVGIG